MYGIGRAEAARFERHSRCFELHSRVLRATQQKGTRAVSVIRNKFPHFLPRGSGAPPDLSFTRNRHVGRSHELRAADPIDLWPCDYCPPGPCEGRRGSVLCIGRSLTLETEYSFRTYTREVTSFPPCGVHGSLHLPLSLSTKRAHGMRHITSSSRRSS